MENLPKNDGYCVVHHRNDDLLALTRTNFLVHFTLKKKKRRPKAPLFLYQLSSINRMAKE